MPNATRGRTPQPKAEAFRVTSAEDAAKYRGAEIVLKVPTLPYSSNPSLSVCQLTMQQAWDVRDALGKAMHEHGGRTLIDQLWELADAAYDELMADLGNQNSRGKCRMAAQMLAVMTSRSFPSVKSEMLSRHNDRNA
jgi:hypothetical protein